MDNNWIELQSSNNQNACNVCSEFVYSEQIAELKKELPNCRIYY